jgi:predicted phage terminase large subunit-like protein
MSTQNKIRVEAEICRQNFYEFVKKAYPNLGEGEYCDNWHIDLLCRSLVYLYKGEIESNNLAICIPPSHMKSILCSVMFPMWLWIREPQTKFLMLSYADNRSWQDSQRRRMIFHSEWYQSHFPLTLTQAGDNIQRMVNTAGGSIYCCGIASQITGEHANYMILDDILNADDRFSDLAIKKMIDVYSNILPSRFSDPRTGKKIIIGQRLSDKDVFGYIQEINEPFQWIILPEQNDGFRYASDFADLIDPRSEGELLWVEKFDLPSVLKLQFTMSKLDIAGQYQQRPSPLVGGVFKKEWFKERFENSDIIWRFLFVDSAQTLTGDYTSILCCEIMSDYRLFIRNIFREKLEFPDLIKAIKEQATQWKYHLQGIVIEGKSSGQSAIQLLRESADEELANMIVEYQPKKSKDERAKLQTIWTEKGRVILPPPSPNFKWLLDFETELFDFPKGKHDDMVDTFVMCLEYLEDILADGYNATKPNIEKGEDEYAYKKNM